MNDECLMVVKGYGAQVHLYRRRIEIHRKGVVSFLNHGLKGVKEINVNSITAIQLKKPGLINGYIQFAFSGSDESKKGTWSAVSDENSVMIANKAQFAAFQELKEKIYELQATPVRQPPPLPEKSAAPMSVADEIQKLWDLGKQGLLTIEEFEAQKKKLLNQ